MVLTFVFFFKVRFRLFSHIDFFWGGGGYRVNYSQKF